MRYNGRGPARPMKRRVLNLLTVLSLVLCVAVCVLWVRTLWATDYVGWQSVTSGGMGTKHDCHFLRAHAA